MLSKLTSRKFWVTVAAMLAGIGSTVTGLATDNVTLAGIGALCSAISAGIYAASEAYVDGASLKSTITTTSTNISATSTSKEAVSEALAATTATKEE